MTENSVYYGAQDEYDDKCQSGEERAEQQDIQIADISSELLKGHDINGMEFSDVMLEAFEDEDSERAFMEILTEHPESELADLMRKGARFVAAKSIGVDL